MAHMVGKVQCVYTKDIVNSLWATETHAFYKKDLTELSSPFHHVRLQEFWDPVEDPHPLWS